MFEKLGIPYYFTKILLNKLLVFVHDVKLIINKVTIIPTK